MDDADPIAARARGGPLPSIDVADALLDEHGKPNGGEWEVTFFQNVLSLAKDRGGRDGIAA
jgi:hypothetical protein